MAVGLLPGAAGQVTPVIENPSPISAVFDELGGVSALDGAHDVEVFEKEGRIYAIVTAWYDDGVQIMDITNPEQPVLVSAVFDNFEGFSALDGAHDVEVFEIEGQVYAIVTAWYDDGVQIMDITNPEQPVLVSAVFDNFEGFSALDGAHDVEVFEKEGRIYAIVTAWYDDGVQIMDITNPEQPVLVSAVFDNFEGFSALDGAHDVEVFEIEGQVYAIVTAWYDDGVQIIDITNPEQPTPVSTVFDNFKEFSSLDGAGYVTVFEIEGQVYAMVTAWYDDGVQIMDITNPAQPTPVSAVFDELGGFSALDGAHDVEVFEIEGQVYAIVTAQYDNGVQIMDITNPAQPTPVSAVFDNFEGFSALDGAHDVDVFEIEGQVYAVVTAQYDNGVQIMDITPTAPHRLDISVEIIEYERTSHGGDDLVQVTASITNHGSATLTNDNQDGITRYGELHVSLNALKESYPYIDTVPSCDVQDHCVWSNGEYIAYTSMTRGQVESRGAVVSEDDCTAQDGWSIGIGTTTEVKFCYWVDTNFEPESMQFYHTDAGRTQAIPFVLYGSCYLPYMRCDEASLTTLPEDYTTPGHTGSMWQGGPVPISAVFDGSGGFSALDGADHVEVFEKGGRMYAIVTALGGDGVQIMDITNPAQPVPVSAVFDNFEGFSALDGAHGVAVFDKEGRIYAIVTAWEDDGVQIMDITNPAQPVPVSAVFDNFEGFSALDGAHGVAVFDKEGRIYAIVTAWEDDGVQIMDITNPAQPVPVSAVFDNFEGFSALEWADDVKLFENGGRMYAIVVAWNDDGVQIMDITNPAQPVPISAVFDNFEGFSALDGAHGVEVFENGGRMYAIVTAGDDDGVQIIDITNPAQPVPVSAVFDNFEGFSALDAANYIEVFEKRGRIYTIVTAWDDDGVQIMDITNPAQPVPVSAVFDESGGFSALDGANDVEVFEKGGRLYAIVTGRDDDGVQIMDITNPIGVDPHPDHLANINTGGFYTNLNVTISVTDYQRTVYGANSLIQINAHITNRESLVLMGPNHQNNYRDGETLIFLGGTIPPLSKGTEYRNSFGYGDRSSQWLRGNGADVSAQDCTSEGYWTDIQPAQTGVEKLCFWTPSDFTPDGLFIATYDVIHESTTTDLNDVIIMAQIIPFTTDSAYCGDHPDICNTNGLQTIVSDTYEDPHPPYVNYVP